MSKIINTSKPLSKAQIEALSRARNYAAINQTDLMLYSMKRSTLLALTRRGLMKHKVAKGQHSWSLTAAGKTELGKIEAATEVK